MSKVLVIDINKKPQNPIHPAQARQLLRNKKAAIFRQYPFVIILTEARPETTIKPLRIKIDPGSKFTGLALVEEDTCLDRVSASNFVALDTDKKLETPSEYQFFIQNRTNCRK